MRLRSMSVAILGACLVLGQALPAKAQQGVCDSVMLNGSGDWVAKQDMTLPGPNGTVTVGAGQPVPPDMQERLDNQCK